MAAQSGIAPTAELTTTWATALSSSTTRLLKITIDKEQLVPAAENESKGSFESDFELFGGEGVVEEQAPAYYLYRLEPTPSSQWIFYSYVPDAAPVRAKMLYASSRAALTRALGDERFSTSVFATNKADLTHSSYLSHLSHLSSEAPLTQREQEMEEIRKAEAKEQREGLGAGSNGAGRSMLVPAAGGASVGLGWSEEAKNAVEELKEREGGVVQLEIEKETVVLSSEQPSSFSLPASSPSYTFYNHPSGLVFIYSCPPSSPIKSRLVYSSSASGVVSNAKQLGVNVLKKIETSDPAEIDDTYILSELRPLATSATSSSAGDATSGSAPGSGTSTPLGSAVGEKPAFARPSRPGRR